MKKTKISKIGKRGVVLLAVLVAISMIVSASLLPYFGKIKTTVNVESQAVEIGYGNPIVWHPYNNPIEHTIPHTSPGGETFCFKQWIKNGASIPVNITFNTNTYDGIETKIYALTPTITLILENKDSNWDIISDDGIQATLTFDTVANTFNYDLMANGLTPETEYVLIYYADYEDRMNNWGGDNPGAHISTFITDGSGNVDISGSVNLDMNLPSEPDANIDIHDYSVAPDNYAHGHGAKIWIVPLADYDVDNKKVINWNPDAFLFETDLVIYLDCNKPVEDYFCGLIGDEVTDSVTVQSGQIIPILICYKFDLHISIGTYILTTIVDATEA